MQALFALLLNSNKRLVYFLQRKITTYKAVCARGNEKRNDISSGSTGSMKTALPRPAAISAGSKAKSRQKAALLLNLRDQKLKIRVFVQVINVMTIPRAMPAI